MLEHRCSFAAAALLLACAGCDSPSESARPGPPARLEIVSGDRQELTVGEQLPAPLVVRLEDANGVPVPNQLLNFRVIAGEGSVLAGAKLTDEQGLAEERWTLGIVAADTQRVEVRALDVATGQALLIVSFTAVGKPAAPAVVASAGPPDRPGSAGRPLADSVAVKVTDVYGNAVPGTAVVWRIRFGGGAVSPETSTTDAQGVARAQWTLGPRMDSTQVLNAAAGVSTSTEIRARASIPPAVVLTRVSGDAQRGTVGTELAEPLVVVVALPDGRPLPGATVSWTAGSGGRLSTGTADGAGRVSARWALGTVAGQHAATAAVEGAAPVSFAATADAASPHALIKTGGDAQTAIIGLMLPRRLSVRVNDEYGNAAPGVPVHWAVAADGGLVHPDTSWTDSAGIALTTWTLGNTSGNTTVTVAAGAAPPAVFSATAQPAGTKVVFLGQPLTGEAGGTISPAIRIAIQNEFGTTDVTATAAVTLSLADDTSGAVLAGTLAVNAVAGIATFTDLRVDRPGTFTLVASSYGLGATSAALRVRLTVATVSAATGYTCAVSVTGTGYCWGWNGASNLGDGTTAQRLTPTPVASGLRFTDVSTTGPFAYSTCAIAVGGGAHCWGAGFGATPMPLPGDPHFTQLSPGPVHYCGVTADNSAHCRGANDAGQLGDGTTTQRLTATLVAGSLKFKQVTTAHAFSCGVTTENRAYCWGYNAFGQLGDGTLVNRTAPTPVAGDLQFVQISAGDRYVCGVTSDDKAYCWGLNHRTQLGDGSEAHRLTPSPVAGGLRFVQVSAGFVHTCGVTADHEAYCWGSGVNGRLGDGAMEQRMEPALVAGGLSFARVSAGNGHTCGVTTANRAYCWGFDGDGALGDGTTTRRLTPTPVAH